MPGKNSKTFLAIPASDKVCLKVKPKDQKMNLFWLVLHEGRLEVCGTSKKAAIAGILRSVGILHGHMGALNSFRVAEDLAGLCNYINDLDEMESYTWLSFYPSDDETFPTY